MILRKKIPYNQEFKKNSYAQCGEDIIVAYIFKNIGIKKPTYMDVGAHHPYRLNNTALFYENGCRGINIEPDITLFKDIQKYRPLDINLNVGISDKEGELDFYLISSPTLNTFSKEEADKYVQEENFTIKGVEKVKVTTVGNIIQQYAPAKFPDFLSIDAEGVDELILNSIDFELNYPIVICVETISFSTTGRGVKNDRLIDYVKSKGYLLYADTNINSIFVRNEVWFR